MDGDSFARARSLSSRGNVIPVTRELTADCLTPVMAYLAVSARSRRAFLLESVEGGERVARYSFVGRDPWRVLTARGRFVTEEGDGRTARHEGDFLDRAKAIVATLHPAPVEGLPRFTGGAVGYIGYGAAARIHPHADGAGPDTRGGRGDLPDACLGFHDTVLAFDHVRRSILLVTSIMTGRDGGTLRRQHAAAVARLDRIASDLSRPLRRSLVAPGPTGRAGPTGRPAARPGPPGGGNAPPAGWLAMVGRAKDLIRDGDIYQVVLSRRFTRRLSGDPFAVYRVLRRINPSPYMYFLRDGRRVVTGASPEMLVRVEGRQVEVHPIAGTRPRGRDAAQDAALEAELIADAKERAEHVMLVDLGRNDVGRVCSAGSVAVPDFMKVERFSHVMHLVSRVTGTLAPGRDAFDALRSAFPAGTVSGAPKIRAMQVIRSLETAARGPYAGAVCYIDHSGSLDSCIIIRTLVATGRTARVQAGCGIVADSDPAREYREIASKAQAVLAAIDGARP